MILELREIWLWYCEQRFQNSDELPPPIPVSPWQAIELFFDLHPQFTARSGPIKATAYSTSFDDEADGALAAMAMEDSFASWDQMSAGAWRVMYERLVYAEVVAAANAAANETVIARLPKGLDRQSQARALMLQFLLGGARTIDPRLLEKHRHGSLPDPAALRPIRKQ